MRIIKITNNPVVEKVLLERQTQLRNRKLFVISINLLLVGVLLVGCNAPQVKQGSITVSVTADGKTTNVEIAAGSTVEDAFRAAGIIPGSLDRSNPPLYTLLSDGSMAELIRVREEFTVDQVVIPYEQQQLRNESLPVGEEILLQTGQNGLKEITTRRVLEDDVEVSSNVVKTVVLKEALPQITMVGVQKPFAPVPIPGRLAYLLDGNAWVMDGTTANRRQVVSTNDLDGRVFSLSTDRSWLLFSRRSDDDGIINTLWVASVEEGSEQLVDLGVENVVHFADWKPDSVLTVGFSTVEPRTAAPGWQANNDLGLVTFSSTGFVRQLPPIVETNSGGIYGWWGTDFAWSPNGLQMAYARSDSIGVIDLQTEEQHAIYEISPLQTFGDWAWVPGLSWGSNGKVLFSQDHQSPEDSQTFDLVAVTPAGSELIQIASQVGMFAYPVSSPSKQLGSGESAYRLAYLQALFPSQSENSKYRLMIMDRDGSNRRLLFPVEGAGIEPQRVEWSPKALQGKTDNAIAFLYQNNLWMVDASTGEAWQVTSDGLTSNIDWK